MSVSTCLSDVNLCCNSSGIDSCEFCVQESDKLYFVVPSLGGLCLYSNGLHAFIQYLKWLYFCVLWHS